MLDRIYTQRQGSKTKMKYIVLLIETQKVYSGWYFIHAAIYLW